MTDFGPLILDTLALLGGGRGSPLNDITPHLLGTIFWSSLIFYLVLTLKRQRTHTDYLMMTSFIVLLVCESSLFVSALLQANGVTVSPLFGASWRPVHEVNCIAGRVLLGAAFLQFLLRQRQLTVNYLAVSMCVIVAAGIYSALPIWPMLTDNDNSLSTFDLLAVPSVSEVSVVLLLAFAIYKMCGSRRQIRWPIIIALSCLLLESILGLLANQLKVDLHPVLDPIRGNLQLWTIPFIAYVALRVRHVEGKRLETGIQASERLEALGQLSSGIAHDFNNHLQIILGYTELARTNPDLDSKQRVPLKRIEEAAQSAGALVNQLLAFSRGQPPKFKPVDLNEIITRLSPMLSRLLGPDVRLVHDLDLTARKIRADEHMIEQIIINLFVNSKDAITEGGTISIQSRSLSKHDGNRHTGAAGYERTQLLVADTGMGMDEKTLRRVFEPFFTTKPIGKGTGLGLSTVYSAVQKHDGTVFVKSEPGRYTRVYVEFPVCTENTEADKTDQPALNVESMGETMLLAEDETAIRDLAKSLLQSAGYNVLVAQDGQHAINIMRTYKAHVDLCIFDVTMPVLNGYDTYDRVVTTHPDTPVLFITGNTSRVAHVRNHLPHLQKPFSKTSLLAEIRRILKESKVS